MITTLMVVCSLPIARNFAASLQVQFLPIVGNWIGNCVITTNCRCGSNATKLT